MGTKKRKSNRFGIAPSFIFLNLTIITAVCAVGFLAYNVINGTDTGISVVAPFTPVTSETEAPATTEPASSVTTSSAPTSSDVVSSQDESSDTESDNTTDVSTIYDTEYFDDALFIGDSISTGLSLYGFLDSSKVFALQGLAPTTALEATVNDKTLQQTIETARPKKIFIMLGTNAVGYAETEYLVSGMEDLISSIDDMTDANIYVLTIPPVTKEAEADEENYLTIDAITDYNTQLKAMVENTKAEIIDLNEVLSDDEGYFVDEFAEMDGIHFMGNTYKVMLSLLESKTSDTTN